MININNLSFKYSSGEVNALEGINLHVSEGGFLGIIGPSGAGKTTLTEVLNGVIPHYYKGDYYGKVIVNGMDCFDTGLTDIAKSVGTVFQDIDSQMVATVVEDEILYGLENYGVPHEDIEKRISDTLEMVGITHLRNRSIASLSGGQKQKVAIAAILALNPKILILDEPTGELDPASSRQIFTLLKKLNEERNMTIVVVEQKIMLLCEFAKELGVISEGKFIYHGSVEEVLSHSEELEKIGVQCPRVVSLSNASAQNNIPMDFSINTVKAKAAVEKLIGHENIEYSNIDNSYVFSNDNTIIDFQHVTFRYTIEGPSLNDLNFKINRGEMVALIGENGAGKSTTSKLMNGLLKPVHGNVFIDGLNTLETKTSLLAKKIGFLFQNPDRQLCRNTVYEELLFSMQLISSLSPDDQKKKVDEMIELMGLSGEKDPFRLSRGERQRVALASVLVTEPDILVLDEPTTGLDYNECIQIMNQVKKLNEEKGITVIMVCHDMELVLDYAKRVMVLAAGTIQADGNPSWVFRQKAILNMASLLPPQIISLSESLDGRFSNIDTVDEMIKKIKEIREGGIS